MNSIVLRRQAYFSFVPQIPTTNGASPFRFCLFFFGLEGVCLSTTLCAPLI